MGEPSAVLTSHSLGRMILVTLLVFGCCWTGCLGESPPPESSDRALDIGDRLEAMTYDSGVTKTEPIVSVLYDEDIRSALTGGHENGQSGIDRRLINIKRLLENLAMVNQQFRSDTPSLNHKPYLSGQTSKKAARPSASSNAISEQNVFKKLIDMYNLQNVGNAPNLEIPTESVEPSGSELPFQVVASIDLILSEEEKIQRIPSKQYRESSIPNNYKLEADISADSDENFNDLGRLSDKQIDTLVAMKLLDHSQHNGDGTSVSRAGKDPTLVDSNTALPDLYAMSERLARQNTLSHPGLPGSIRFHIDDADRQGTYRHPQPYRLSSDDVANISPVDEEGGLGFHDPTSLKSLIHRTVQKMEDRLKKRKWLREYNDENDVIYNLDDTNTQSSTSTSPDQQLNGAGDASDDNAADYKDQHIPAAVLKAVLTGSIPADRDFWQNLSSYLDSKPYLSRSRRNADDYMNQFKRKMRARLSITYGHVMPCEFQDRYYCMNGGTCVFVGALKLKTCRCPIGYTGLRCMMIDQEYILSLLTNSIFS